MFSKGLLLHQPFCNTEAQMPTKISGKNKAKLSVALLNTGTGERCVVEGINLSLLELNLENFGMEILKKADKIFTEEACSACLCLELLLWREKPAEFL